MSIRYSLAGDSATGRQNIAVWLPGLENPLQQADDTHPNFDAIVAAARAGDESVAELFDVAGAVAQKMESLSDRVAFANDRVFFDGDEVTGPLVEQILEFIRAESDDYMPLVNFWEKIAANPNQHSREQLYRWLKGRFTIHPDGDLVGYKGVNTNLTSVSTGPAIVDGLSVNGHVPNQPGTVVTMARSQVNHDPATGCSTGLHVGTWEYANNFGRTVLEVKVNPRDVVSVPTDCSDAKMRACRYEVVKVLGEPYGGPLRPAEDIATRPAEDIVTV